MSVYGCRELRNVTFLGYFSNLFPPLEEHNPCINYHIYDPYTRKVVPANREEMERISVVPFSFGFDILHAVQLILDEGNSASNDYRQTLLYANYFSHSKLTFEHLKQLQNKRGWDIIILCALSFVKEFQCPTVSWIPVNRIFPIEIDQYCYEKYLPTLIENPKFDVIEWHRTITPDNDDNSCIIKQDTVVNILPWGLDRFLLIQNAISILSYLPISKNVKFKFHSPKYFDIEFLNMYLERYNVENFFFQR